MIKLRTVYIIRGQYEWDRFVEMAEQSATKWCTYDSIEKEDYHTKFKGFDCICMWIDEKNEATYSDYRWYQKEYRSNSAAYPFCIEMSELLRNVIDMEAFDALLGVLA
jgi:hypothetical protein